MKNQYAQYAKWFLKPEQTPIPASVDIDLTNVCNQDCFYCNSAEFRASVPVQKKWSDYITLLDQLKEWGSRPNTLGTLNTITYTGGGEPTVLPGYEKVLEHTLDLGFMTAMITNGSRLDQMIEKMPPEKIRDISWIGIDIDAGNEETYEQIRRSLTKTSVFERAVDNAARLVKSGARVDFKVLLTDLNTDEKNLRDIFAMTRDTGVRQLYFRPLILDNRAWQLTESTEQLINDIASEYGVDYRINKNKYKPRNYKRCHAMYAFPVFCADGGVYLCCEGKGQERFKLCNWDTEDFRDHWNGSRHREIYENIRVEFCHPCRPNQHNIEIENIIKDPNQLEQLFW